MSRIFLSHSSANNDSAIALRDWLTGQGWNDVFLDLDPRRGIAAGDRWERTLHQAALRCEAVLFLVSRAWLASEWCLKELNLAHRLNKRLFGLLIEDIPIGDLPASLAGTWQLVPLASGRDHVMLRAVLPGSHDEVHVTFSQEGLNRLRIGLERAGLDARFFAWPPEGDSERPPYRGLLPLEAADAGIFFGREAPTVEALDRIRGIRDAAPPRLMVVLGASGSGKSSFLRAGLLPRLARDDRNYLSLPVVRPERGVITGASGLLRSLEAALAARGLPTTRSEIRDAINGGATTLRPLLRALVEQNQKTLIADDPHARASTLVLAVDQGEELFRTDGSSESTAFFALLRDLMLVDNPALLVLVTIRSDSYDSLQTTKALEGIAQQTMSLVPMPRGAYQSVIEGPAVRLGETSHPLVIEPALTQALLSDIEGGGGRDALPLLAFTLERLYIEYGARGRLTLNDYDVLGRIKGSIEAAIERVFRAADSDSRIPRDRDARLALLRRGLIPWLAGIDPDTGTPRRQKARISEIPTEARPLIDLLVEQRLLSTDASADAGDATIEPAHEALLRQWGLLQGWLQSDFAALMNLEAVKRAAREWEANARNADWLAHRAGRLEDAQQLLERPDLAPRLDPVDRGYLTACLVQEAAERRDKAAALERELALQSKARKRDRAFGIAAAVVAILMTGLGALAVGALYVADLQRQAALESQSQFLARDARTATDNGTPTLGKLLAARALPKQLDAPTRPFVAEAEASLQYAYEQSRELLLLKGHQQTQVRISFVNGIMQGENVYTAGSIDYAIYSPDGTRIVTSSTDGTIRIWNAETGAQTALIQTVLGKASHVSFLPDGRLLVLTDKSAPEIRDAASGALLKRFDGGPKCVVDESSNRINMGAVKIGDAAAAISPDGSRVVTVSGTTACLWDSSGTRISVITAPGDRITVAKLSGNGKRLLLASDQGAGALLDVQDGKIILDLGKQVASASFSHDGKLFAVGSFDKSVTIRDASDGHVLATLVGHDGAVRSLDFSPDGSMIATGSDDQTARLWNTADGSPHLLPKSGSTKAGPAVYKHPHGVQSVTFGGDGRFVLVTSGDNEGVLWNVEHGWQGYLVDGTGKNTIIRMSRDGRTVVTYSDDQYIRIWKDGPGPIATMKASDVTAATISPDGKRLVSGSNNAVAQVWTLEAKRPPAFRWLDHHQTIHSLDFTASNLIVTTDDNSIALRDPGKGELVRLMKQDGLDKTKHAVLGSDGRLLMTLSDWGTTRIWNLADGKQIAEEGDGEAQAAEAERISQEEEKRKASRSDAASDDDSAQQAEEPPHGPQRPDNVKIVASPDHRFAAALAIHYHEDPRAKVPLQIMDLVDGSEHFRIPASHGSVTAAAFSGDGHLFAAGFIDGTVIIADVPARRILGEYAIGGAFGNPPEPNAIASVLFSHGASSLFAGIQDGSLRLLRVADGHIVKTMTHGTRRGELELASSPDGSRVVTTGGVNIKLWTGEGELVANLGTWGSDGPPLFSPDGSRVLTVNSGTALLWDSATGRQIASIYRPKSNSLNRHGFSRDGKYILTTHDWDPNLYLWDGHTGEPLAQLDGIHGDAPSYAVAVSPDGKMAAAGGDNGAVTVWQMPERCQALIDRAAASTTRPLTDEERARYFLNETPETGLMRWLVAAQSQIPWLSSHSTCEP